MVHLKSTILRSSIHKDESKANNRLYIETSKDGLER